MNKTFIKSVLLVCLMAMVSCMGEHNHDEYEKTDNPLWVYNTAGTIRVTYSIVDLSQNLAGLWERQMDVGIGVCRIPASTYYGKASTPYTMEVDSMFFMRSEGEGVYYVFTTPKMNINEVEVDIEDNLAEGLVSVDGKKYGILQIMDALAEQTTCCQRIDDMEQHQVLGSLFRKNESCSISIEE